VFSHPSPLESGGGRTGSRGGEPGRLHGAGLGCDWEEKEEGKKNKGGPAARGIVV
jgi:hypothetical protein